MSEAITAASVFGAVIGFFAGVIKAYLTVTGWVEKHKKAISPLILEAEKAFQDGEITKDERKSILLTAIKTLEDSGQIKLKYKLWIIPIDLHWLSSILADQLAQKLPDSTIAPKSNAIIAEAIKRFKAE